MDRSWLTGTAGNATHAILCAVGQNLRLLLRAITAFFAPHHTDVAHLASSALQLLAESSSFARALRPYGMQHGTALVS